MRTYHIAIDTTFAWQGQIWRIVRRIPDKKVNIESKQTLEVKTVSIQALQEALFNGSLFFIWSAEELHEVDLKTIDHRMLFEDYDIVRQAIAKYRLFVIKPLLGIPARKRFHVEARVKEVLRLVKERKTPIQQMDLPRRPRLSVSIMSVYRWIRFYLESDGDIRSLVPNSDKQGKKKTAFTSEVELIMSEVIDDKALEEHLIYTLEDIHDEIVLRVTEANWGRKKNLRLPSASTVYRRLQRLGLWDRFRARRGKREAYYASNQFGKIPEPEMPLDRVEIDHTQIDLIVVDEETQVELGRPWLTCCLDVKTRMILGYYLGFEKPSYFTVRECLYNAIMPKTSDLDAKYGLENEWVAYGVPRVIVIDNGKEFHSGNFDDACLRLSIVIEESPAYTPHFKAFVERVFKTIATGVLKKIAGATFSNIQERGDYKSMKEAKITLSQLDAILHLFIVDVYAQKFHKGLKGYPARRWEAFTKGGFEPRLPESAQELSILLGATEERRVHPDGIELHTLRYNCPELALLRARLKKEPTKIKYHPGDLSRIFAYDPVDKRYIEVPALEKEYTQGLSMWMHRVIRKYVLDVREEYDDQIGRAMAKRKIDHIVNGDLEDGKTRIRTAAARWKTAGATAQNLDQTPEPLQDRPAHQTPEDFGHSLTIEELQAMGFSSTNMNSDEEIEDGI